MPGAAGGAAPLFLEKREVAAEHRVLEHDAPGYWEVRGYHNRGDPWEEERYS
jgi:DMSO/TMAO reductase YedYZ molybdopterin-dependent catalytic subunit